MSHVFKQPVFFKNPARILPDGLSWYALISKTAREAHAADWLESSFPGCFTLVPLETRFRPKGKYGGAKYKRVNAEYQVPLMARYVFAGFGDQPNWLEIFNCPHVSGAISLHGAPIEIPEGQIERFRSHAEKDRLAAGLPVLRIGGTAVFVGDGIFSGHLLEIADLGPNSADVWVTLFGAKRKARVSRNDLEAA